MNMTQVFQVPCKLGLLDTFGVLGWGWLTTAPSHLCSQKPERQAEALTAELAPCTPLPDPTQAARSASVRTAP